MQDTGTLDGFDRFTFEHEGRARQVYRAGSGPAVIVIHEIPGLHPGVIAFGRRLVELGYTVYLPSLFGRPGAAYTSAEIRRSVLRTCVSREFAILVDRTSRVVTWLRALSTHVSRECAGSAVGVIGMCFTGGFALATAVEPVVSAAVLSQPSLPFGGWNKAALGLDTEDRRAVAERADRDELGVLALRFSGDDLCPRQRFDALRETLGDAFTEEVIDSSPGNPHGISADAHSVLTVDLVDDPGHPTGAALRSVLDLLETRVRAAPRI